MIVLWRPQDIAECDWRAYRHCWTLVDGDLILERPDTPFARQQAWDTLPRTERVIWTTPHFIPAPSMSDELDVYESEKFEIITLRTYDAIFQLHGVRPALWNPTPDVSRALVVFNLKHRSLPSTLKQPDFWPWLGGDHARLLHVGQTWADDTTRSTLGAVYPHVWGHGELGLVGRTISGGTRWIDRAALLARWRQAVESWEFWLKRHA